MNMSSDLTIVIPAKNDLTLNTLHLLATQNCSKMASTRVLAAHAYSTDSGDSCAN